MTLCDLHTHVLPGVDDGAPTMEYALQMLENAVAGDVEWLVVTPHCHTPYGDGNYLDRGLQDRFAQLQDAAQDMPIHLMLGAEVRVDEQLPLYLRQGRIPTLNGGRYLLTEFAPDTPTDGFIPALEAIRHEGYIPLVAHPERYAAVCDTPQTVLPWLDMGCHLQLTGGSIIGAYGQTIQRTASTLLKNDLVACVASDAHGLHGRSNYLLDVCDHLTVRYSKSYAACLLYETPLRICRNDDL